MKSKISRGAGFRGLADYLTDGRGEIIGGTCSGETAQELAVELKRVSSLRPEVARPVWHSSLSLPAGEHLTDEQWRDVAHDYMQKLGYDPEQTAYVIVKHDDTDHEHIHIAATRVQLDSTLYLGRNENLRAADITQELEIKYGLERTPDRHQYQEKTRPGYGDKPAKKQLQERIDSILKTSRPTSRPDFEKRLTEAGIEFKRSTGGYSFSLNGEAFKGSQLGKAYTASRIDAEISKNRDISAADVFQPAPAPAIEKPSVETVRPIEQPAPVRVVEPAPVVRKPDFAGAAERADAARAARDESERQARIDRHAELFKKSDKPAPAPEPEKPVQEAVRPIEQPVNERLEYLNREIARMYDSGEYRTSTRAREMLDEKLKIEDPQKWAREKISSMQRDYNISKSRPDTESERLRRAEMRGDAREICRQYGIERPGFALTPSERKQKGPEVSGPEIDH